MRIPSSPPQLWSLCRFIPSDLLGLIRETFRIMRSRISLDRQAISGPQSRSACNPEGSLWHICHFQGDVYVLMRSLGFVCFYAIIKWVMLHLNLRNSNKAPNFGLTNKDLWYLWSSWIAQLPSLNSLLILFFILYNLPSETFMPVSILTTSCCTLRV